ncbi:DUF1850 domain-containing protein [Frigidibacter sp. MR17.14]|uniref:DUF1850 domain-containing protein n=1 Tax=Frigidibacter sp. MR17.14 TaxID=3126509 RepID=UPI0030130997
MTLCLAAGAKVLALAVPSFTLSWTHSVERVTWWERWEVRPEGLRPTDARVEGTGAGMEIPDNAVRDGAAWVYHPRLPLQPEVLLAASGKTPSGWTFCTEDGCRVLGATAGAPIRLWTAESCPDAAPLGSPAP